MSETGLEGYQRYAVYYAPPRDSLLARLGAAWFGRDDETGEPVTPAEPRGLPAPRDALTAAARRYGFHATLKAPFRLGDRMDCAELDEAVTALAAGAAPVAAPRLRVDADLGFVALRPRAKAPELDRLAAACVTELDLLRAPLSQEEVARRRRGGLDAQEEAHLRNWGYPFVLDRFKFHITLTGRLVHADADDACDALQALFTPALEDPFTVTELCLFGEPGEGEAFRLLKRYPLAG